MFKTVIVSGNPYERGLSHGKQAEYEIRRTIRFNIQKMEDLWKKPWEEIRENAGKYGDYLEKSFPEYMEEMRGIADGSGCLFKDILASNCRYELSRMGSAYLENSCTTIGISSRRSANGHTYICENWDWAQYQSESCIILKIDYGNGRQIYTVTEGGILGRMGRNNRGIVFAGNTLKNDLFGLGLPVHIMMRKILECDGLQQVKDLIRNNSIGSSYNLMVGSSEGILDFEVDNSQITLIKEENGTVCHTNTFIDKELRSDPRYTKYEKEESMLRYESARRQLERKDKISIDDLKSILRSHDNHPYGICTHAVQKEEMKKWATLASMIVDIEGNKMYLAAGNPCECDYEEI